MFRLSIGEDITWNKLCAIPSYRVKSRGQVVLNAKVFFWAEPLQGNVQDLAVYAFASDVLCFNMETKELMVARAKTVIIATGGAGRMHYQGFPTSNHYGATADGLVLGYVP